MEAREAGAELAVVVGAGALGADHHRQRKSSPIECMAKSSQSVCGGGGILAMSPIHTERI